MKMKLLATAAIGGAALLFSATGASAYVVCNDRGDCWHSTTQYTDPTVHLSFYDDNWNWKEKHYHWHEVSDVPGYWDTDKGSWVVEKTTTTTTTTTADPH